jgi:hypothetical protein
MIPKLTIIAIALTLTGCAQLAGGGLGLSSATLTVPCPGGTGSASYNAPFGFAMGTVTASCSPGPGGGTIASISNDMNVDIASIISDLISMGVLVRPNAAAPAQSPDANIKPDGYSL